MWQRRVQRETATSNGVPEQWRLASVLTVTNIREVSMYIGGGLLVLILLIVLLVILF
jgi:hypothetical protein